MRQRGKRQILVNMGTLFYFCFALWYGTEIFFRTSIEIDHLYEDIITYIILALLIIQDLFYVQYTKREIGIIVVISILVLISTIQNGSNELLSAWIFIISFKNCDFNKIARYAYKILSIMIPLIILFCLLGIIPDKIYYRYNIERHSLGFGHPNQLGIAIFHWALCYVYNRWDRFGIKESLFLGGLTAFVYIVADSQTATISIGLLLLMCILARTLEYYQINYRNFFSRTSFIISLLMMLLSIILTYIDVSQNDILRVIDLLLSSRFSWCHRTLLSYGAKLFGQNVYLSTEAIASHGGLQIAYSKLWLDNAYAALLIQYGIAMLILFVFAYLFSYKKIKISPPLVLIFLVYAVYGTMERGVFMMRQNMFLLVFAFLLYQDKDHSFAGEFLPENDEKAEETD